MSWRPPRIHWAGHAGTPRPGGHGIAGMTERAQAFGSWLRAGPRPDSGLRFQAWLPAGPVADVEELTPREREVVALIAAGLSNDEIAGRLYVSSSTAKTHATRTMAKLRARDRAQLVASACGVPEVCMPCDLQR